MRAGEGRREEQRGGGDSTCCAVDLNVLREQEVKVSLYVNGPVKCAEEIQLMNRHCVQMGQT